MENIAYEIAQWVANHPGFLLAPVGISTAGALYLAIDLYRNPPKYKEDFDEESFEDKGLVKKLNDVQGEE